MHSTTKHINSLSFSSLLCIGVGIPSHFYDYLIAEEKVGVDKYDKKLFPRSWSNPVKRKGVRKSFPKDAKFDLVVINDSKHYADLDKYFKQALKSLNEGGKIVMTHSVPNKPSLVTKNYKPHQSWCGDVVEFILSLKSKGGYKIETYAYDYGVTEISIDESVEAQEIDIRPFEDWYFERKQLMNIVG